LCDVGFDFDLVMFVFEVDGEGLVKMFVLYFVVRIIDYIGGLEFGEWFECEVGVVGKVVYIEKVGVNIVVIDLLFDLCGVFGNLVFLFMFYSG